MTTIRLSKQQFSATAHTAPEHLHDVQAYARPQAATGPVAKLNSLQQELDRHPNG